MTQHLKRTAYPNDITRDFISTIQLLSSEECETLLMDHCTMQELRLMTERWAIAKLIWFGFPYRVITEKTGASSTTIARVAHWIHYGEGGYARAFQLKEKQLVSEKESLYPSTALGLDSESPSSIIKRKSQPQGSYCSALGCYWGCCNVCSQFFLAA
jgi:TrpR-related protein YerC/YecD